LHKVTVVVKLSLAFLLVAPSLAQTIQVDITPAHSTNHFRPDQTLGAGIDRIPSEAVDSGLAAAKPRQSHGFRMAAR